MLRGTEDEPGGLTLHRIWQFGFPFLLFLIVRQITVDILMVLFGVPESIFAKIGLQTYDAVGQVSGLTGNGMAICQIAGFLTALLVIRKKAVFLVKRAADETWLLHIRKESKKGYIYLGITTLTSMIGLNLLLELSGVIASSESYQNVAEKQYLPGLWLGLLLYAVAAPLAEEVLFRGIIYNSLRLAVKPGLAAVTAAVFFGIYHGNFVQGLYGFLMGLLMIYGYEYFGKFRIPILMHVGINTVTYLITYATKSGRLTVSLSGLGVYSWTVCLGALGVSGLLLYRMHRSKRVF